MTGRSGHNSWAALSTPVAYNAGVLTSSRRRAGHAVCSVLVALLVTRAASANATPPDYRSLHRVQKAVHTPDPDKIMRIWIVYVGQGDGMVIQMPHSYDYDPDSDDGDDRLERFDIVIDGGSAESRNADNLHEFLRALYPGDFMVEHAVITHHDQDHVLGLERVLADASVSVLNVFHNGLASFLPEVLSNGSERDAVVKRNRAGNVARVMAEISENGISLERDFLIESRADLEARESEFQGVYANLANAVLSAPNDVANFRRAFVGGDFIGEVEEKEYGSPLSDVQFRMLWPLETPRQFNSKSWSHTINGNSITFKLTYGNFEMLFTGDHNQYSERALMDHLGPDKDILACDVLKIPHHGSDHGIQEFFDAAHPVMSVASQGPTGARAKTPTYRSAWQHPSTTVIRWLGGHHRVYLTELHERRFSWDDFREDQYERSHVLIETDGEWFRIVEVPVDEPNVGAAPSVSSTRRSNGTRWIRTK